MKLTSKIFFIAIICCIYELNGSAAEGAFDDNDYGDFEDFESDEFEETTNNEFKTSDLSKRQKPDVSQQKTADGFEQINADGEEDGVVEDDDNENEHFQDEEEFEGFDGADARDMPLDQRTVEPKLTMAKIPLHFRTHWDSYWMEMLMLGGLLTYFVNFFLGKSKNSKLAHMWLNTHKSLLEDNFALVGDDGKLENENPGFLKESESLYTLWCSGRTCCEGMLVELKMIKRQDLVVLVSGLLRPQQDQIHIKIEISKDVMDSFVLSVGSKKTITKMFKEYADLSKFCSLVNKPEERYKVPTGYSILSEIPEATSAMLETRVIAALDKYQQFIDYIHISDQFSGPVQQDDPNNLKQPEVKRMLMAGFIVPKNGDMEIMKPLLILVFYIMERLKCYRMSKDGKMRAEKNRLRVEEEFLKSTHAARAEAAAQRREDKRKQEKERVLAEDDPEKQRRWELKEQKRQAKKKGPKMKRLAVKSL